MSDLETALWWARVRAAGPQRIAAGQAAPAGMLRLVEPDAAAVWLLPDPPLGARATVLDELGLPAPAVDQPNDTARALATCLRCCWPEPTGPIWPGVAAGWGQLMSVFQAITDHREEAAYHRALLAAVRRLAGSGWLRWDDSGRIAQLGPRVVTWSEPELSTLRELWRLMPAPSAPMPTSSPDTAPPPPPSPDPTPPPPSPDTTPPAPPSPDAGATSPAHDVTDGTAAGE